MPEPTIVKGSDYFFVTTYEGNGGGQRVGNFIPFTDNGTIAKSCIFNDGSSSYLSRTHSASNKKTFTFSAWIKRCATGAYQRIFNATDAGDNEHFIFRDSDVLHFYSGDASADVKTNRTFEDTSKFYHIVLRVDTTQSTASDRVRIYVDGEEITSLATATYPSQNADTAFNGNVAHDIGRSNSSSQYFDGYMAEVNFADGQSYGPDTFGLTDTSTGRWIPKSLGSITYGTNGFRLTFANSAGQTIGDDTSGNTNDFTVNNIATTDITTDSPTQNFITFDEDRYLGTQQTTEEGGLTVYASSGSGYTAMAANKEIPQSGKWYWEVKLEAVGSVQGITNPGYGVIDRNLKEINNFSTSSEFHNQSGGMGATFYSGFKFSGLLSTAVDFTIGSHAAATNDYVVFAFDMDDGKAWWGFKDGSADLVWYANDGGTDGNPATGANPTVTFNSKDHRFVPVQGFYAPGSGYSARYHYNFGQKAYAFTAPTGFSSLSQNNFAETGKGISDFVWIKNRDATDDHQIYDSSRGKQIAFTVTTAVQSTVSDGLQKFLKGGQQIEDDVSINTSGESYVSWNWVANGGTTSANTDGSGGTVASTIQANQTAGFSIVEFTAPSSGTNPFSVAHGLGKVPKWFMFKRKTGGTSRWLLYHKDAYDASNGGYSMELSAASTNTAFNTEYGSTSIYTSDPTTTTFSLRNNSAVTASVDYIAYCWAEIDGFSRFGEYIGNASTNGPFVYTGFKPSWVLVKNRQRATGWYLYDNKRTPINQMDGHLFPNATTVETTGSEEIDFLSNGFKCRGDNAGNNRSGEAFIYMAFAEHPFIGDGTNPCTAR